MVLRPKINKIPKIGAHKRVRILFLTLVASVFFFLFSLSSWFENLSASESLDGLHKSLQGALWLVVFGVVIEEWYLLEKVALFIELTASRQFKYAVSRARVHRKEVVEGIGFAILIIGLSGELVLDPAIEGAQKAIEEKAGKELQEQKNTTAQALQSAGEANLRAANATRDAAKLGLDVENLHDFVTRQRTELAASLETLKSTEAALEAAIKRANERLAPREFIEPDVSVFVSTLSQFAGSTIDVWVSASGDAEESTNLGVNISNALQKSHWKPSIVSGVSAPVPGIVVALRKPSNDEMPSVETRAAASALLVALGAAHLITSPKIQLDVTGPEGMLRFIGLRDGQASPLDSPSPIVLFIGPKPD